MKKVVLLFIFLSSLIFAKEYKIESVDGNKATIVGELPLNYGGIIEHRFDATHSIILSYGFVESVSNGTTTLKLKKFDSLYQDALPTLKTSVKSGDIFKDGYFHNRAIIIAPNLAAYKKLVSSDANYKITHIDNFAAYLSKIKSPYPSQKELFKFCKDNFIGLVLLVINDTLYKIDTISQKVIEKESIEYLNKDSQIPFYSRVDEIDKSLFDFSGQESIDYSNYYKSLFGVE
jgi:hypothetical protein